LLSLLLLLLFQQLHVFLIALLTTLFICSSCLCIRFALSGDWRTAIAFVAWLKRHSQHFFSTDAAPALLHVRSAWLAPLLALFLAQHVRAPCPQIARAWADVIGLLQLISHRSGRSMASALQEAWAELVGLRLQLAVQDPTLTMLECMKLYQHSRHGVAAMLSVADQSSDAATKELLAPMARLMMAMTSTAVSSDQLTSESAPHTNHNHALHLQWVPAVEHIWQVASVCLLRSGGLSLLQHLVDDVLHPSNAQHSHAQITLAASPERFTVWLQSIRPHLRMPATSGYGLVATAEAACSPKQARLALRFVMQLADRVGLRRDARWWTTLLACWTRCANVARDRNETHTDTGVDREAVQEVENIWAHLLPTTPPVATTDAVTADPLLAGTKLMV
jgi:hypothetical protein